MSKRYYFPNRIINNEILPFIIKITKGLSVYYSYRNKTQMRRADVLRLKTRIIISIDNYEIPIMGVHKGQIVYKIFQRNKGLIYETKIEDKKQQKKSSLVNLLFLIFLCIVVLFI